MAIKESSRAALREAVAVILAGNPVKTDRELTWNNVCVEAEVPRSTAARAADVIAEWKAARAEYLAKTETAHANAPRAESVTENSRSLSLVKVNDGLRNTIRVMANHIQALTLALRQKEALIAQLRKQSVSDGKVVPMSRTDNP